MEVGGLVTASMTVLLIGSEDGQRPGGVGDGMLRVGRVGVGDKECCCDVVGSD